MQMRRMWQSKAVAEAGYDASSRTLRLIFRTGGRYDYHDVPAEVFDAFTRSAHPWREWGDHIRRCYRFRRLE